jgi:hypothetical protein
MLNLYLTHHRLLAISYILHTSGKSETLESNCLFIFDGAYHRLKEGNGIGQDTRGDETGKEGEEEEEEGGRSRGDRLSSSSHEHGRRGSHSL